MKVELYICYQVFEYKEADILKEYIPITHFSSRNNGLEFSVYFSGRIDIDVKDIVYLSETFVITFEDKVMYIKGFLDE